MSPIPEFTDTLSEVTKPDGICETQFMEDNTKTDRNINESDSNKHSRSMPQSSQVTSKAVGDDRMSEDIGSLQMATEINSNNSMENLQNETLSQAGGSPMEEHWLEVSISGQSFIGD
jgi:hypothetical protein